MGAPNITGQWKMGSLADVFMKQAQEVGAELKNEAASAKKAMADDISDETSLVASLRRFEKKPIRLSQSRVQKARATGKPEALLPKESTEQLANNFNQRKQTPGQDPDKLARIRNKLADKLAEKKGLSQELSTADIIAIVEEEYREDPGLGYEALDFVMETTRQDTAKGAKPDVDLAQLHSQVHDAQIEYKKNHERDIKVVENTRLAVKEYVAAGRGTATEARQKYNEAVDAQTPIDAYNILCPPGTSWKKVLQDIKFVRMSVAADINSSGPSIEHAKLVHCTANMRQVSMYAKLQVLFDNAVQKITSGRFGRID